MQAACYCDAAGNGGSGVSALIESDDVVADLLQPDILQSDAILIEPCKVAVQIIGVGVDGTGRGPNLGRKSIKPELGQPSISVHEILLCEDPATAPATNFLSKCLFDEIRM